VDFFPDPSPENLQRLDSLLQELGGKVDVGGSLLAGGAISTFLRAGDRTLVATELGQVDVLQGFPQVPPFATLEEKARDVDLDGVLVRACSLEHLVEMKRASDRARDQEDLAALEAFKRAPRKGNDARRRYPVAIRFAGPGTVSAVTAASQDGNHHL
jgi:hypothetical protein